MKITLITITLGLLSLNTLSQSISGKPIDENSKKILLEIMDSTGVTDIVVTSTNRTVKEQVNAMYVFIVSHSVDEALAMYGIEGDAVVLKYKEAKEAGKSETEIKQSMESEFINQLPSAFRNNHLMHVGRENEYYVFDISISKLKPSTKLADFQNTAKSFQSKGEIFRFLGTGNGEKDALHFEFKK